MLSANLLSAGRSALARAFLNDDATIQTQGPEIDAAGYPTGGWVAQGSAFKCCLDTPKGTEIPEALSRLNREIFWLAFPVGTPVQATKRVVIGSMVYEIHTTDADRTNGFLPRAMVSRLGPVIDPSTGYPAVYQSSY